MGLNEKIQELLEIYPENPSLQDTIVYINHLLEMDIMKTPLMKFLTGFELILLKLQEWELIASKRINSVEKELLPIKIRIIKLRKTQTLSWKNLLR